MHSVKHNFFNKYFLTKKKGLTRLSGICSVIMLYARTNLLIKVFILHVLLINLIFFKNSTSKIFIQQYKNFPSFFFYFETPLLDCQVSLHVTRLEFKKAFGDFAMQTTKRSPDNNVKKRKVSKVVQIASKSTFPITNLRKKYVSVLVNI